MSEMLRLTHACTWYFMEEKTEKTTAVNSGYRTRKKTILREEEQTYSLLKQRRCWVPYITWQLVMITVDLVQGGTARRYCKLITCAFFCHKWRFGLAFVPTRPPLWFHLLLFWLVIILKFVSVSRFVALVPKLGELMGHVTAMTLMRNYRAWHEIWWFSSFIY